jgi:hypothetical protein
MEMEKNWFKAYKTVAYIDLGIKYKVIIQRNMGGTHRITQNTLSGKTLPLPTLVFASHGLDMRGASNLTAQWSTS